VRDQVSHPYSTTDKITVLYIFIFRFFWYEMEGKRFWTEAFTEFNLLLISSWTSFLFVSVVPKYLNFVTFPYDSLAIRILVLPWVRLLVVPYQLRIIINDLEKLWKEANAIYVRQYLRTLLEGLRQTTYIRHDLRSLHRE
jgi:hypothetical protein